MSAGKKQRKSVTIDADVAIRAGSIRNPNPKCEVFRNLLALLRQRRCTFASNVQLSKEWKKYASEYAVLWLTDMVANDLYVLIPLSTSDHLMDRVLARCQSSGETRAIQKDYHLVATAIQVDRIIFSCDDKARKPLCRIAKDVTQLKSLSWANPNTQGSNCLSWVRAGMSAHTFRLGT